jgi:putative ATP-dependent endonuclease of OLD family
VACIADRDIPPAASRDYVPASQPPKEGGEAPKKFADDFTTDELKAKEDKLRERDGAPVKTFVSPSWTLEHDLATYGLASPLHRAICLAKKSKSSQAIPDATQIGDIRNAADAEISKWEKEKRTADQIAALIYKPLFQNRASKAETAQFLIDEIARDQLSAADLIDLLPEYLIDAIAHVTEPIAKKKKSTQ